ncbi:MAG: MBL fold metallo-hydrolase [Candidatus Cryptobacteroides sp.]
MLKFVSLSSGSSGNCYLLTDGVSGILIDAGVSFRTLKKNLMMLGYSHQMVRCVLVTHDHLDHIRHLGSYCKHLRVPVYATETLHRALSSHVFTRDWIEPCRHIVREGEAEPILTGIYDSPEDCPLVSCFVVPHDATQTVGYFIRWRGRSFFLMTDAGRVTEEAAGYAARADAVVIESNYDREMLFNGPYPQDLKMRISRGNGHLGNHECAEAVGEIWHPGLRHIFLCHLSENNNTPALAFAASAEALKRIPLEQGLTAKEVTDLQTLPRTSMSAVFTL